VIFKALLGVSVAASLFAGVQTLRIDNAKKDLKAARADVELWEKTGAELTRRLGRAQEQIEANADAATLINQLRSDLIAQGRKNADDIASRMPVYDPISCPAIPASVMRDIGTALNASPGAMQPTGSVGERLPN